MNDLSPTQTFAQLLAAQPDTPRPIDDVLFLMLPLLRQVTQLHAYDLVAPLDASSVVQGPNGALQLRVPGGQAASQASARLRAVQPAQGSALNIIGEVRVTRDSERGVAVDNLQVQDDPLTPIEKPVFVPGFTSWELLIGHHDQISDIFQLGQMMACLALGLNFKDAEDVHQFADHRRNLFLLAARLNPVLASVIVEMTELNRHQRATDLPSIIQRLEHWRDQPVGLDVERVLADTKGPGSRRTAVLEHLRDRLFDLSRRNRLLHFRPTQANVNLTIASVPLVMHVESIQANELCTWGGSFAEQVLSGKPLSLHKWLRFDDQPYLPASLDKLIQETRRDRSEFGFSNLRLVVAFMRWHNLKETPEERILSPLLWLPVELVKKKGVRDQYVLQCDESQAEFNPVLRHQLRQLYDIQLPETIDLSNTSLAEVHADITRQIRQTEPGVEVRLQSKPAIELIHQKAVQRLQQFQRKRGHQRTSAIAGRPDFSYERDDYRPLGLALFHKWVWPTASPLRGAVGALPDVSLNQRHAVAAENSKQNKTYHLPEDQGHQYAWDIDLTQVTLANFNYKKMSLVRDYAQLIDEPAANAGFDRMFSIEPREVEVDVPPAIPLHDQWNVVPGDATQNAAVSLARTGRNFIIQGPPGTGKSQTITNLIADYAGQGLRVLFVCEKRAALDVVFHRLQQSGLDELCCLIHDSQTDKKAFVSNLRECYEAWVAKPQVWDATMARRTQALQRMSTHLQKIERFDQAMAAVPAALASSVRQLVQRLIELPAPTHEVGAEVRERLPSWAAWQAKRELSERLYAMLREKFGVAYFAAHPFSRLSAQVLNSEQVYGQVKAFISEATKLLEALEASLEHPTSLLTGDTSVADGQALSRAVRHVLDFNLAAHLDLLDEHSSAARALAEQRKVLHSLNQQYQDSLQGTLNWRDKLSPQDTLAAQELDAKLGDSVLRWFNPSWWRLRGEMRKRYDFSKHAVQPKHRSLLQSLAAEHAAQAALLAADKTMSTQYGVSDSSQFVQALESVAHTANDSPLLRLWLQKLEGASDAVRQSKDAALAAEVFAALETQLLSTLGPVNLSLNALGEFLRDLQEDLEDLPDCVPLLRELHSSDAAYVAALQQHKLSLLELEALIASEALARLYRNDPELAKFDERELTTAVSQVSSAERDILQLNAKVIDATLHRNFLERVKKSALSATQLDEQGKLFKKNYAKGRRELEHEFGKSMRYRAIRELASGYTGLVINDIKPIWLMSPLSVSDTLPLQPDLFDVVIFDEASQIPSEEAIPALSRAQQVIVVGDEMQLPPSSFFATSGDEEDDQVLATEDGELVAINLDADSLLSQAARNLPATLLAWHYRSRHEALISFSNAAFYDGRLITIPDRQINQSADSPAALDANDPQAPQYASDALLASPISFIKVANGVYENRCNLAEAQVIAGTVRELLNREIGLSIGIVAFSEAQQTEIETALETLAAQDQQFATLLEREYLREDNGQFNGLFVKNLENVQGDERDIILLSICYAPGPSGKMLMNFGPINQRGGEKRLNVIFSRARHRMAVVTSIHSDAITNTHNDGASALKAFLQFAEASSRGEGDRAQSILSALNPGAQRSFATAAPYDALRTALAKALRAKGHVVHEHVGSSQFRCDLAIVDDTGHSYRLGIQLDSSRDGSSVEVRDRYVFQPTVLRSFGWKVIDVPGKQWLADPAGLLARIDAALRDESPAMIEAEAPEEDSVDLYISEPEPDVSPIATNLQEYRFEQGGSAKFWRISVVGNELTVNFGRMGSKGQTLIKNFDTQEKAEREANKLIDEKVRKGYLKALE